MGRCVQRTASLTSQLHEMCFWGNMFKQDIPPLCLMSLTMMWLTNIYAISVNLLLYLPSSNTGTLNQNPKNAKYVLKNIHQLCFKMFSLWISVCKPLSRHIYLKTERSICKINFMHDWARSYQFLIDSCDDAGIQTQADLCVSPVPRLVHPQCLPTPLSYCHVAMATWEGPAFTPPGSQRRSLTWGKWHHFLCLLWLI